MRNSIKTGSCVAALVLAGSLLATGCGSGSAGGDGSQGANAAAGGSGSMSKDEIWTNGVVGSADKGTPKNGGTLTVADYTEARSLDPTKTIPNGAAGGNALAAIYDVLERYDVNSGTFEPWLAKSLTPSKNDTVWTLKLRKGVTFTDGTPLNAAAVLGSIGYYMKNAGFNTLTLATNIKTMLPQGADTVVFTMNAPWTSFPAMLAAGPGMVVAPAAYKDPKNFKPIGAGPFTFGSYKPSEDLVLNANPGYWNGKPHLAKLRFVWLGSDSAKMDALKSKAVDVAEIRAPEDVESARKAGYAGIMSTSGLGTVFWINNRAGHPGHDLRIRQAINAAINPDLYAQRTSGGAGLPTRNVFAKSQRLYADIPTAGYDPAKAKKLVAEAKAAGVSTTITFLGQGDPTSQAGAVATKAMLEAAGFTVKTETLTNVADQLQRIYVTHDFDMVVAAMSLSDELLYSRLGSGLDSKSPQNAPGYANPMMDKLVNEARGATPAQQKGIAKKVDELWQQTIPGVILSAGGFFQPWNSDVHGVKGDTETLMLFGQAWKS